MSQYLYCFSNIFCDFFLAIEDTSFSSYAVGNTLHVTSRNLNDFTKKKKKTYKDQISCFKGFQIIKKNQIPTY